MRAGAVVAAVLASPAWAHHEAASTAALLPLAGACAAFSLALFAGWRRRVSRKKR